MDWAQRQGLSARDELSYLHEFEHITLARILLAQYRNGGGDPSDLAGLGLLARLLKAAQEGGRLRSEIEILVLQALANQAQGDLVAALVPLERALALAEPEGYVRVFVDEGLPMARSAVRSCRAWDPARLHRETIGGDPIPEQAPLPAGSKAKSGDADLPGNPAVFDRSAQPA